MDLSALLPADPVALLRQHLFTIVLGLVFVAVALAVTGSWTFVADRAAHKRRLRTEGEYPSSHPRRDVSLRFTDGDHGWLRFLRPLYQRFLPKDTAFISSHRLTLIQAGYPNPTAVTTYYALKIALAAAFGLALLILLPVLVRDILPTRVLPAAGVAALIGYSLPAWHLDLRTMKRKRVIREGFPDALDLLLICVEAGLGLDAAIARVGTEIDKAHPILAEQFRLVGAELRAGRSREQALRGLGVRTGLEDVRSMVTLLIQSDELGTSIGQALRVHASEMRTKRLLTAEEKAHKIPVKLAFPLVLGLLPVVLIVTLTPAAIKIMTFLLPILQNTPKFGG